MLERHRGAEVEEVEAEPDDDTDPKALAALRAEEAARARVPTPMATPAMATAAPTSPISVPSPAPVAPTAMAPMLDEGAGAIPQPVDDAPTRELAMSIPFNATPPTGISTRPMSPALAALARAVAAPPERKGDWLSPAQATAEPASVDTRVAAVAAAFIEPEIDEADDEMELDGAELEDVEQLTPPPRPRARTMTPVTPVSADDVEGVTAALLAVTTAAAAAANPSATASTPLPSMTPTRTASLTPAPPMARTAPAMPAARSTPPAGQPAQPSAVNGNGNGNGAANGSTTHAAPASPAHAAPSTAASPPTQAPHAPPPTPSAAAHAVPPAASTPAATVPPPMPAAPPPMPAASAQPHPPAQAHPPAMPAPAAIAPAAAAPAAQQADAPLRPRRKRRAKQWFEEIFDDDYLRTLPFLTPRQTEREAQFIHESLQLPAGAAILDLACGYGRHAMELAAKSYKVTGLDLSLPLLIRAADAARRVGVNVNFIHGDMREMTFEDEFDAACCMFTSFGYFDDDTNRKVAANLARAIKPGGKLLIEVVNRDYLCRDLPTRVWWQGDGCVVLEEVDFNYFSSRLQVQRSIIFEDGRQLEQEISIRAYSLHEIGKVLHHSGFRVTEVSGGLTLRGKFFGANSRQLIVVAEKKLTP